MITETRATVQRRLRKAAGLAVVPLNARRDHPPLRTQLSRVTLLMQAARLEVAALLPSDVALRRAICADLDAMLTTLRATSVQAADKDLPDTRPVRHGPADAGEIGR